MPDAPSTLSRRALLAASAGMAVAAGADSAGSATSQAPKRYLVGGFTKMLQSLPYDEVAAVAAEAGWDGIECAVRPAGQVLPERVEDDLPRLVASLRARSLAMVVMVTAIHDPREPATEKVLRTARKLGITRYRLGQWQYKPGVPIPQQLADIRGQLRDLAALNKELGMTGLFQNHSGRNMVGGPVWDIYEVVKDLDPQQIGSQFDIGHATFEGGNAWETHFRLMRPWIGAVVMKDFTWEVTPGRGGRARWHSIGTGMVNPAFFRLLAESGWSGPVTLHFEYPVKGQTDREKTEGWREAMTADTRTLKGWLGQ